MTSIITPYSCRDAWSVIFSIPLILCHIHLRLFLAHLIPWLHSSLLNLWNCGKGIISSLTILLQGLKHTSFLLMISMLFISSTQITSLDSWFLSVFSYIIVQLRPYQYCFYWRLESIFHSSVLAYHSPSFSSQLCAGPLTSFNNHFSEVAQNYETILLTSIKSSCYFSSDGFLIIMMMIIIYCLLCWIFCLF